MSVSQGPIRLLSLPLCGLLTIALLSAQRVNSVPAPPNAPTPEQEFKNHRDWKKVNTTPFLMSKLTSMLCRDRFSYEIEGPHVKKWVNVYVNNTGEKAMLQEKHFPIGSIIVKEKLSNPESKAPDLMTVMVKREKGYNPASGDWEYIITDSTGRISERGKLARCQKCHNDKTVLAKDHVFSDYYLPRGHQ